MLFFPKRRCLHFYIFSCFISPCSVCLLFVCVSWLILLFTHLNCAFQVVNFMLPLTLFFNSFLFFFSDVCVSACGMKCCIRVCSFFFFSLLAVEEGLDRGTSLKRILTGKKQQQDTFSSAFLPATWGGVHEGMRTVSVGKCAFMLSIATIIIIIIYVYMSFLFVAVVDTVIACGEVRKDVTDTPKKAPTRRECTFDHHRYNV